MKQLLFFAAFFLTTATFGQVVNNKTTQELMPSQKKDSSLQIIYADKETPKEQPAFFLNSLFMGNQSTLANINPEDISHIDVRKTDTLINHIVYHGQVYISTKDNYQPSYISLTDLKNKYTNIKGQPVIFTVDGALISADCDAFLIDEKHLLTIIIDHIKIAKDSPELTLIKILTKAEKNVKDSNTPKIMIRGATAKR